MAPHTILFIAGAIALAFYIPRLSQVRNTLNAVEKECILKASSLLSTVLAIIPTIAVFLVVSPYFKVVLASAAIAILFWQRKLHRRCLRECGISEQYIHRLDSVSIVGMIGLVLVFAGAVLEA